MRSLLCAARARRDSGNTYLIVSYCFYKPSFLSHWYFRAPRIIHLLAGY